MAKINNQEIKNTIKPHAEEEDKSFSEDEYFLDYKKIRNKFRKYNSLEVVNSCINHLKKDQTNEVEELRKSPWLTVLLIKWVIADDDFNTNGANREFTLNKLYEILNLILNMRHRMPSQFENLDLFMCSIANQQFMYQRELSLSHIYRQKVFFDLPENHYINQEFESIINIRISDFLNLSLVVWTKFIENEQEIKLSYFANFEDHYTIDVIQSFLDSISINLMDLRNELRTVENINIGKSCEFFEQTPFLKYPLIKDNDNYICVYPNILYRSIEYFIYDKMRKHNADKFMDMSNFGGIFEKYIEKMLNYAKTNFINEDNIKSSIGHNNKLIDFIVMECDANVFIEAKAVEMPYSGKIAHKSQVIIHKTKDSIIKAIEQANSVLNQINSSNNDKFIAQKQNYLLVVTFKNLLLGNGKRFYNDVAKEKLDTIYSKYKDKQTINMEDIYFISIDEFDILTELVKKKFISYSGAIEKAKINDSKLETSKLVFRQHLQNLGYTLKIPDILIEEKNNMLYELKAILSP